MKSSYKPSDGKFLDDVSWSCFDVDAVLIWNSFEASELNEPIEKWLKKPKFVEFHFPKEFGISSSRYES